IGKVARPRMPKPFQKPFLVTLHTQNQILTRGASPEPVGIRQKASFSRNFLNFTYQIWIGFEPLDGLIAGQPFRDGDAMKDGPSFDKGVQNVPEARIRLYIVFACFYLVLNPEIPRRDNERPSAIDEPISDDPILLEAARNGTDH